jgi:tripartite-type tricarboxylate transporter receptor subunit TctC
MQRRTFFQNSCFLLAGTKVCAAQASTIFSERPIVIVDPATAGSSTDIFSRALAEELSKLLETSVVVENKPGAGGALAAEYVARSKPDGHTLGLAAVSTHAANPALTNSAKYHPTKDFSPITTMVSLPSAIVVSADSKVQTLEDLLISARANPGKISFASPGVGSAGHILLEHFSQLATVNFLHVPYRGSSAILNDLLGGQLNAASDNIPAILPHIVSGKLRALAVRDAQRIAQLPNVPTLAEVGYPLVSYPLWFGLVAPAGTPVELVNLLNAAAHKAMRTPSFQRRIEMSASTYFPSTPAQFQLLIAQWFDRFRGIVETVGIRP